MKKINIALIVLLFVSIFTFDVPTVRACSWVYKTPVERLQSSDLVFKGVVTAYSTSTVMINGTKTDVHKITLKNNTYWKGNPGQFITVTSSFASGTSCSPARAEVGREYMIFANKAADNSSYTVNELDVQDTQYLNADIATIGTGTAIGNGNNTTAQCKVFNSNSSIGARGQYVAEIQMHLINSGYVIPAISNGSTATGYFGAQTAAALKRYQKNIGVAQTGMFDANTRNRMFALLCSKNQLPPTTTTVTQTVTTTQTSTEQSSSMSIANPNGSGQKLVIGQPFTFIWQSRNVSATSTITIALQDGLSILTNIKSEPNSTANRMTAIIPATLKPGFYYVKVFYTTASETLLGDTSDYLIELVNPF
ncbi:MAG: peptidoglycan-binding domain-containing protein [Patescibacteria group bacterium]